MNDFNPRMIQNPYFYGMQTPYNFPNYDMTNNYMKTQIQSQPTLRQVNMTVALVPTIDSVEQVQMAPNETKIVFVQNDPDFLAIRVSDGAGFVKTEYRTSKPFDPKLVKETPQFVTIDMFSELKTELEQIKNNINNKGVSSAKSNKSNVSKQPASNE